MTEGVEFTLGNFSDLEDFESDSEQEDSGEESEHEEYTGPGQQWDRIFLPNRDEFEPIGDSFSPQLQITAQSSPLTVLKKLFKDEIVDNICHQTNQYAALIKRTKPSAMPKWFPLTKPEFWTFVDLNLAMGISRRPSIPDYWSSNEVMRSPFFPEKMSRNRFEDILRALHFHNNEVVPANNTDRFIKLDCVLNSLLTNFKDAVNPGEYLCLDETLMAFHGRLSFRQYNPKKRNRFGIKYFLLVDCMTKVVIGMVPYQGRSTDVPHSDVQDLGFGGATVMKMLQPYLNLNHKVVIDNYFTSPNLAHRLLQSKTYVLGTAQKRRKNMPQMTSKMRKGEVQTYSDGSILVERWKDRREVIMLNTFIPHSMQHATTRNPHNSRDKPNSVLIYNKTMGAVDEMDKTIKYYANMRKTYKWYKKVFFYLLDVAIYNAFQISFGVSRHKVTYKSFLLSLINEIFKENPIQRSERGRPSKFRSVPSHSNSSTDSILHMPVRMLTKNGKRSKSDCAYCKPAHGSKRSRQTQFECETCKVRLCITPGEGNCYQLYHSEVMK